MGQLPRGGKRVRGPGEIEKMKNKRESRGRKMTKHRKRDKIRTRGSR